MSFIHISSSSKQSIKITVAPRNENFLQDSLRLRLSIPSFCWNLSNNEESEVWSLSSRLVRAWWALPRDGARSYLGRSPAGDDDPVRCFRRVKGSPLSANILSHPRTLACTVCSWSRKWSGSRRRRSRAAGSPKREILDI